MEGVAVLEPCARIRVHQRSALRHHCPS
jgi:hypothetical protein